MLRIVQGIQRNFAFLFLTSEPIPHGGTAILLDFV